VIPDDRSWHEIRRKMEQAIAALMSHRNIEEAAKVVGISAATLKRWMHQPEFKTAYLQVRLDAVMQANARIQQSSGVAASVLFKSDGGPKYSGVDSGARGARHPGVRQQVPGNGKLRSAPRGTGSGGCQRTAMKAVARRIRRLENQLGPAGGRVFIAVTAFVTLALDADTCVEILRESGFLPTRGFSVVGLYKIPAGLNAAQIKLYLREHGAELRTSPHRATVSLP
jgi:hypothetical protein